VRNTETKPKQCQYHNSTQGRTQRRSSGGPKIKSGLRGHAKSKGITTRAVSNCGGRMPRTLRRKIGPRVVCKRWREGKGP